MASKYSYREIMAMNEAEFLAIARAIFFIPLTKSKGKISRAYRGIFARANI